MLIRAEKSSDRSGIFSLNAATFVSWNSEPTPRNTGVCEPEAG